MSPAVTKLGTIEEAEQAPPVPHTTPVNDTEAESQAAEEAVNVSPVSPRRSRRLAAPRQEQVGARETPAAPSSSSRGIWASDSTFLPACYFYRYRSVRGELGSFIAAFQVPNEDTTSPSSKRRHVTRRVRDRTYYERRGYTRLLSPRWSPRWDECAVTTRYRSIGCGRVHLTYINILAGQHTAAY